MFASRGVVARGRPLRGWCDGAVVFHGDFVLTLTLQEVGTICSILSAYNRQIASTLLTLVNRVMTVLLIYRMTDYQLALILIASPNSMHNLILPKNICILDT